jgi:hypothetical protein
MVADVETIRDTAKERGVNVPVRGYHLAIRLELPVAI